jgi:predicted transcriptional regulator
MYNANLNYSQLKNQINTLTGQGLFEKKLKVCYNAKRLSFS